MEGRGVVLQKADEGIPGLQMVDSQFGRNRMGQGAAIVDCGKDPPGCQGQQESQTPPPGESGRGEREKRARGGASRVDPPG